MTNVRVAIRVVGHHSRGDMAQRLAEHLDGIAFVDDGTFGEWRNHMRAFASALYPDLNPAPTHVCVLQEDALLPEAVLFTAWLETVQLLVAARPDELLGLYIGKGRGGNQFTAKRVAYGIERGASWFSAPHLLWGVGVVLPVAHIPALLAHEVPIAEPGKPDYYDNRLGSWWFRRTGRHVLYPYPSLVDHDDSDSVISQRDQPERKAFKTGLRDSYPGGAYPLL